MLLLTFAAACPVDYVLVAQTRCLRLFTNHDAVQLVTSTSAGRSRDDQLANVTWYYKTDLVTWSRGDHVTWWWRVVTWVVSSVSRDHQLADVTWYYKTDLVTWSRGDHVTWWWRVVTWVVASVSRDDQLANVTWYNYSTALRVCESLSGTLADVDHDLLTLMTSYFTIWRHGSGMGHVWIASSAFPVTCKAIHVSIRCQRHFHYLFSSILSYRPHCATSPPSVRPSVWSHVYPSVPYELLSRQAVKSNQHWCERFSG